MKDVKLKAWVACDLDGNIFLHLDKPYKLDDFWIAPTGNSLYLDSRLFPTVDWEDAEPTEVEITIKIKEPCPTAK